MLQSAVRITPEAVATIEHLEGLLVGLAPIVARRSNGIVYALLGRGSDSTDFVQPERVEFVLQEAGFFTAVCLSKDPMEDNQVQRAMEVALTLNAAVPRGTFVVKGCSWLYRCEFFLLGNEAALREHLRETIRYAITCYGIFQKMFDEHVACRELEESLQREAATDLSDLYQDPLLRDLFNKSLDP